MLAPSVLASVAIAALLVACAGQEQQAASPSPAQSSPSESLRSSNSPSASPSPSPSDDPPPMLLTDEAIDALISAGDFKGMKAFKGLTLQDVGTSSTQLDPAVTIKPSDCANVRTWLRSGTVVEPGIGPTASTFFFREEPYASLAQKITPSEKALPVLQLMTNQAREQCASFTESSPASLIINNGPPIDLSDKKVLDVRELDVLGWPTTTVHYRVSLTTSASVTNGSPPIVWETSVHSSAVGPNLVTTMADSVEGSDALYERAVSRVIDAMAAAGKAGRSTTPQTYVPTNAAEQSSNVFDADDPTLPIEDVTAELLEQWQGPSVKDSDVRKMVLLVCRESLDVPLMQPAQSLYISLQNMIVAKFGMDRVTGSWNAWNVVTTSHARCQGHPLPTTSLENRG